MSFSDLESVFSTFSNIFGGNPQDLTILGVAILLFFATLFIYLNLGFEAFVVLILVVLFGLINRGLLPVWIMALVWLGAAAVLTSLIIRLLKKQ